MRLGFETGFTARVRWVWFGVVLVVAGWIVKYK